MFFYKIEDTLWSPVKTFIVFLNRLPEYPHTYIHDLPLDDKCLEELERIQMDDKKFNRILNILKRRTL